MRFILSLIFTFLIIAASAQIEYNPKTHILWNEYYKLSWDDFKAPKDPSRFGDAGTSVMIIAKPFLEKRKVYYQVYAIFDKSKSWGNNSSEELLAHEQLHFDIAELYARKVRKKVAELRRTGEKKVANYNKAINIILQKSNEIDEQYDKETFHGVISDKQAEWNANISAHLKALEDYKHKPKIIGE